MTRKDDGLEVMLPKDPYNVVYWIIFLVGIICMLPWDMMVTVNGYWHYKFRNITEEDIISQLPENNTYEPGLTKRQKEFESYISIASSIPSATTVITHAFIGNRFSIHGRAIFSLVGMIITFTGIIVMAYLDSDAWQTAFLISNLTLAVIINIFRALFRAANSANMGKFPVEYMGSLANGICMGGLMPVMVNIMILSLDVDIQMAGFGCFVFSCLLAMLCLVLFLIMEKTEFYQFYTYKWSNQVMRGRKVHKETIKEILNTSWLFILTAIIDTTTTALVYPAATSLVMPVNPTDSDWHEIYFSQVTCFLTFNVCNYLGTTVASIVQWPGDTSIRSQVTLFLFACLRVVFIPIFMTCNLAPKDRHLPVLLDSDTVFIVVMILFSLSDGYITNMSMMFGPKSGKVEHQELTAGVMVASLASSIMVGSIFSNLIVKAL